MEEREVRGKLAAVSLEEWVSELQGPASQTQGCSTGCGKHENFDRKRVFWMYNSYKAIQKKYITKLRCLWQLVAWAAWQDPMQTWFSTCNMHCTRSQAIPTMLAETLISSWGYCMLWITASHCTPSSLLFQKQRFHHRKPKLLVLSHCCFSPNWWIFGLYC